MEISLEQVLSWTEAFAAIALVLSGVEFIQMRAMTSDHGVWQWNNIRNDFSVLPKFIQVFIDFLLRQPNFNVLIFMRLLCSFAVLFWPNPGLWLFLFLATILVSLRWRGSFNGGSDYMILIVLTGLLVVNFFGSENPKVALFCFAYIAIQSCTSYFVAGSIKLKNSKWRQGKAIGLFLSSTIFANPPFYARFFRSPIIGRAACWFVIAYEMSFPLALVDKTVCLVYIFLGMIFHLMNWHAFGLNRFILSWAATYPSFCFFASFWGRAVQFKVVFSNQLISMV